MRSKLVIIGLVALIAGLASGHPYTQRLDGFSVDALFWLRHQVFGPLHSPETAPVAVIALDEESYRRPPFSSLPKALWTPQLARVIDAVLLGGASVIGQDLILPTSVEGFVRGYDRPYLLALRSAARDGRLVLGKVQHQAKPISPFPAHSFAVGHEKNIRLVNLFRDPDGSIRRVPLSFISRGSAGGERIETGMALELAARAAGEPPGLAKGIPISFRGAKLPGSEENTLLLNFATGGPGFPVYSLADLFACAEAGDSAFFERVFAGKAVLLGSALDVEDRKVTSARFVTVPDRDWFDLRCRLPVMEELYDADLARDTIPGTFVFATAVDNLLRGDTLSEASPSLAAALTVLATLLAASAALYFRPPTGLGLVLLGALAWALLVTFSFRYGLVLPLLDPPMAAVIGFAVLVGYRFMVTDREKRQIRRAFGYYLPGSVIDRMERSNLRPELGGETRDLTVFFSDIAGFTQFCEGLEPSVVVRLMNRYLNAMTQAIEARGGFVDKYIGDAIVAVFGAPLEDSDHARHAVLAALDCQRKLAEIAPKLGLPVGEQLNMRIGLNSGSALIGNIGSDRRFNYTVMGDTVNLAARLEGANKIYGSAILISGDTASRIEGEVPCRVLESVRVIGRQEPVLLYDVMVAPQGNANQEVFRSARVSLLAGRFTDAAEAYDSLAADDPVAAAMAVRARELAQDPPAPGREPVRDLESK